jgi:tight adherence protein C
VSAIELEAIIAGVVSGVVVAAFFIAMDINRAAAKAGAVATWTPTADGSSRLKQFESLARPLTSRMPAVAAGQLREKLSRAGDPGNLTASGFQALRYGLGALLALVGLTLGLILPLPVPPVLGAPMVGAVLAVLGYMGPSIWLEFRISSRKRQIQRSLAEATDLLTLVVESGMSLDEGLLSITERFHNALGDEIGKVLREIRLGRPRMVALEHMAEVSGVPDLHHLVESIVQSDQMGVPIARLLRVQATEMRRRQRQTAQERAAQASSRMVFPMVGCIFPVLWIVLLGPALIQIFNTIGH